MGRLGTAWDETWDGAARPSVDRRATHTETPVLLLPTATPWLGTEPALRDGMVQKGALSTCFLAPGASRPSPGTPRMSAETRPSPAGTRRASSETRRTPNGTRRTSPGTRRSSPGVVSVSRHGGASDLGWGRRETRRNEARSGERWPLQTVLLGTSIAGVASSAPRGVPIKSLRRVNGGALALPRALPHGNDCA
jgi:hypothetical protein